MINEIPTLLARHMPGYEIRSMRALGEGLDNAAFEVNVGRVGTNTGGRKT